jgi:hypothetical protein
MIPLLIAAAAAEPMLDGRCDDYAGTAAVAELTGVKAYVRQTTEHVWLCFAVPEGSYASLDLTIQAPKLAKPLNLHASAQLGEWAADNPAAAPANASSPEWWNVDGWWASTTPFNGAITTPQGRQVNFRTVAGRELQLSKRRFGTGAWSLSATLADVQGGSDTMISVRWPRSGSFRLEVK